MLLTISTTYQPATDLSYLLYKNPSQVQSFDLTFGKAIVFYPERSVERCTVALLLEIDPIKLVRRGGSSDRALEQYVNDRPYVASSFLSVTIAEVFGTALSGKSRERQELADTKIPLQAQIAVLPCKGGEGFLKELFEPLGYKVEAQSYPMDGLFPEWGMSPYFTVTLTAIETLRDLLNHLYVLMPVLDDEKHYWVGDAEVEKLLRHGEGWLARHPARDTITRRYLKHRRSLVGDAIVRLSKDDTLDPDLSDEIHESEEAAIEKQISLNEHRLRAVLAALQKSSAKHVIDLGCGEGKLLSALIKNHEFKKIVGLDVSYRALEVAQRRLGLKELPDNQKDRISLIQGSLIYKDKRMQNFDAATCVEVIEHLDTSRLATFERVLFEFAKPNRIILTTPNVEYNCKFKDLPVAQFRHKDHRFEWTRDEFQSWAKGVAEQYGYSVEFWPIGEDDPIVGPPTQMGVFSR